MADVTALVLASPGSSGDVQAIAGLPGLWSADPDLAHVVPEDHGLSVSDVEALAADLGVEVSRVTVSRKDEQPSEKAADAIARVSSATDEELAVLADDPRKTVSAAAAAEVERRATEAAETGIVPPGEPLDEEAGS